MKTVLRILFFTVLFAAIGVIGAEFAHAQNFTIPKFNFIQPSENPEDVTVTLQIFFLTTVLALAPSLFIMTTSFARVVVVLDFVKKASGIAQIPQQVMVSLALFVTAMIMMPVWNDVNSEALQPYFKKEINQQTMIEKAVVPIRHFMLRQTREKDIALFVHFSKMEKPKNADAVPFHILIPAFMISEMKTAFIYGFLIYLPFLVVDMVVASVLLSMGMMVLPPMLIATPFKIILFVLVDGWYLILRSLVGSFH